jgi:hypothetical protein
MRTPRREAATFRGGLLNGTQLPQPRLSPGAGGCPEARIGGGSQDALDCSERGS